MEGALFVETLREFLRIIAHQEVQIIHRLLYILYIQIIYRSIIIVIIYYVIVLAIVIDCTLLLFIFKYLMKEFT